MKIPHPHLFPALCSACLITSGLQLHAADSTWDAASGGAWDSGDLSVAANWDPATVPANDGSADLIFDLAGNTGDIYTGLGTSDVTINSLSFIGTNAAKQQAFLVAGTTTGSAEADTSVTLNLGAGGIDLQGVKASGQGDLFYLGFNNNNRVNVNLTANQTWAIKRGPNGETNNHGTLRFNGDLSGSGNLTKSGNGLLRFESGSSVGYTGNVF